MTEHSMSKVGEWVLTGKSGREYPFVVYTRDTDFKALSAIYVMSKRTVKPGSGGGTHYIIYIGQTGDLSDRPLNHHKKACFDREGADHVSIYLVEGGEKKRLEIEADLIEAYDPPCNG